MRTDIGADLTIEVSATPLLEGDEDVKVQLEEVKAEGMIKKAVILNEKFINLVKRGKIESSLNAGSEALVIDVALKKRDELLKFLKESGIICLIHYPTPIPLQPIYRELFNYKEGEFPKSEELSKQAMDLPLFPELKDKEIKYISERIHEFFDR